MPYPQQTVPYANPPYQQALNQHVKRGLRYGSNRPHLQMILVDRELDRKRERLFSSTTQSLRVHVVTLPESAV